VYTWRNRFKKPLQLVRKSYSTEAPGLMQRIANGKKNALGTGGGNSGHWTHSHISSSQESKMMVMPFRGT
jgi:hypothetical protein